MFNPWTEEQLNIGIFRICCSRDFTTNSIVTKKILMAFFFNLWNTLTSKWLEVESSSSDKLLLPVLMSSV